MTAKGEQPFDLPQAAEQRPRPDIWLLDRVHPWHLSLDLCPNRLCLSVGPAKRASAITIALKSNLLAAVSNRGDALIAVIPIASYSGDYRAITPWKKPCHCHTRALQILRHTCCHRLCEPLDFLFALQPRMTPQRWRRRGAKATQTYCLGFTR